MIPILAFTAFRVLTDCHFASYLVVLQPSVDDKALSLESIRYCCGSCESIEEARNLLRELEE